MTMPDFRGLNLIPFAGSVVKNNRLDCNEIILNLAAFVPFGLYVSMIKPRWPFWKKIIPAAAASLMFELIQYLFAIGGTDITDFLSNTLGGVVGAGLYVLFSRLFKDKATRILNILALVGTIGLILLGLLMMRFVTYRF
jgi:glycopeptide antibiotics resistance protein